MAACWGGWENDYVELMIMRMMMMIMTSDGAWRWWCFNSKSGGSIEVAAIFNSENFSFTFIVCARWWFMISFCFFRFPWPWSGQIAENVSERRTDIHFLGLIFYFIHFDMRLTERNDVFRKNKSENRGTELKITIIERELYYIFLPFIRTNCVIREK